MPVLEFPGLAGRDEVACIHFASASARRLYSLRALTGRTELAFFPRLYCFEQRSESIVMLFFLLQDFTEKVVGRLVPFFTRRLDDFLIKSYGVRFVFDVLRYHFFKRGADEYGRRLGRRYAAQVIKPFGDGLGVLHLGDGEGLELVVEAQTLAPAPD